MELPPIYVFSLSGSVRYRSSMSGLKTEVIQFIMVRARPRWVPSSSVECVNGEYSLRRASEPSTAAMMSGVSVSSMYAAMFQDLPNVASSSKKIFCPSNMYSTGYRASSMSYESGSQTRTRRLFSGESCGMEISQRSTMSEKRLP